MVTLTLTLTEKEIELLKKSINHCLETCQDKEKDSICTDCAALEAMLSRISNT